MKPASSCRWFLILMLLGFQTYVSQAHAAEKWIVGTWELFHDPDGSDKDWIEFTETGSVVSFTNDKQNRVRGTYQVEPGEVRIVYELYGQAIPITLTYKNNKSALYAFSSRTGNYSTYKKIP
ncbi:MAG: hypothetical protein OEZ68_12855 [Gammaproteobacteria bacterium]|nr:hypothetical protein [Gammaproteobacteria bacterium]MDH5801687.1 hypothetical protein [Gammaproteobacteria bacterium]